VILLRRWNSAGELGGAVAEEKSCTKVRALLLGFYTVVGRSLTVIKRATCRITAGFFVVSVVPLGQEGNTAGIYSSGLAHVSQTLESMGQFKFILIGLTLLLSGCMTTKKMNAIMASWMDHDVNDLIADWGPPNGTMSDGKGGQILIFDRSGQLVLPGTATTTGNYIGNATATYNQYGSIGVANANAYGTGYSTTTYQPPTVIPVNRKRMFWVDQKGRIYRWSWKGL
jgi:hypothetical protein